jgi:hypothetical protein
VQALVDGGGALAHPLISIPANPIAPHAARRLDIHM